jgi:hypothetical protein
MVAVASSGSSVVGRARKLALLQQQSAEPLPLRTTVGKAAVAVGYAATARHSCGIPPGTE